MKADYSDWSDEGLAKFHEALLRQSWALAKRSGQPDFNKHTETYTYLELVAQLTDVNREWDRRIMGAIK